MITNFMKAKIAKKDLPSTSFLRKSGKKGLPSTTFNQKSGAGLILIELLAAMVIFALGVMTIFVLFINVTKGAIFSLEQTNSSFLSIEAMEAADSIASGNKNDLFPGEYEVGINAANQWVLIPRAGLMGHFLLANDANDFSGYGNDGTIHNMTFGVDRRDKRYGAGSFNGSNSYIQTEGAPSLQITGPLTVSVWVLGTNVGARPIAGRYNSYLLSKIDSSYSFQITGSEGQDSVSAASDHLLWEWEHVIGVYDPGKPALYLYIDGVLKESQDITISSINPMPGTEFFIGTDEGKTNFWDGSIADVRVYNRALTSNEISGLYSSYSDKYGRKLVVADVSEGLVGYWNFNEGEGCISHDNSSNNNHGILKPECDTWTEDRYEEQGKALEFDGQNDFINIPDNSSLQIENESTVSVWVKLPDTLPDSNMTILHKRAAYSEDYSFAIVFDQETEGYGWAISPGNSGALDYIQSTSTALAGEWQNIVVTFGSVGRKLYVDSNLIDDTADSSLVNNGSDSNLYIGQAADGSDKFEGMIDDVRIYNHALPGNEIISLYLGDVNYYTLPIK